MPNVILEWDYHCYCVNIYWKWLLILLICCIVYSFINSSIHFLSLKLLLFLLPQYVKCKIILLWLILVTWPFSKVTFYRCILIELSYSWKYTNIHTYTYMWSETLFPCTLKVIISGYIIQSNLSSLLKCLLKFSIVNGLK